MNDLGSRGPVRRLLIGLFFCSGVAGLVYQNVWMRQLVDVYGNTVFAGSAVLAGFMAGLAGGSYLGGRLARRMQRISAAPYGWLEILIAVGGLISLWMVPVHHWIARHVLGFIPMGFRAFTLKGLSVLPFILLPTAAMGATFPVFVRTWIIDRERAGERVSLAYSANTLGAFCGTLLTAFVLIPWLGLRHTILAAVSINGVVGMVALGLARIGGIRGVEHPFHPATDFKRTYHARMMMVNIIYFLSGFLAIMLEVVWTRVLVLHLGSSVYAFALMLAMVLLGIGLGSFVVTRWAERWHFGHWGLLFSATGAALVVQIYQFAGFSDRLVTLARVIRPEDFGGVMMILGIGTFQALALPAVFMGMTFPLGIYLIARSLPDLAHRSGSLYAFNTLGAIIAAILTPVFILPNLGVNHTLAFAAIMEAALGLLVLLIFYTVRGGVSRWIPLIPIFLILIIPLVVPARPVLLSAGVFAGPGRKVLAYHEGMTGTVTVSQIDRGWLRYRLLEINAVDVAGTSPDLLTIQKIQGHLPLLLHPAPQRVLHIGFGSGGTAYAVSRHPVTSIDVVEISPEVVAMARRFFSDVHGQIFTDPRVTFYWGDGRNYLLTTRRRYDVILSDSIHPRYAGNGSLYTVEYFRMAAKRLRSGGIFSMWLPLYALTNTNFKEILAAFQAVFPAMSVWYIHNTINPYVVVIGRRERNWMLDERNFKRRFQQRQVGADLAWIGYREPLDLLDNLMVAPGVLQLALKGVSPHRDDRLTVEYQSTRLFTRDLSWRENFEWLMAHRTPLFHWIQPGVIAREEDLKVREQAVYEVLMGIRAVLNCHPDAATHRFDEALSLLPNHREPWEHARLHAVHRIHPDICP